MKRLKNLRHAEGSRIYVNIWTLRFNLKNENDHKIHPTENSSTREKKIHRRNQTVQGTSDDIDGDIESPSMRTHFQNPNPINEESERERDNGNGCDDNKGNLSDLSRYSMKTSRGIIKRAQSIDYQYQDISIQDVNHIEDDFTEYFAIKNLSRQQNMLGIIVIYLFFQFILSLLTKGNLTNF